MGSDDKYITFKRADFKQFSVATPIKGYDEFEVKDAIVIRRQDLFASPALAGYASAIAIALALIDSSDPRHAQLLTVADYFQRQSEIAADEGWKLPDV